MSPRARRVAFGLLVILFGSLVLSPLLFVEGLDKGLSALAIFVDVVLVATGIGIAVTRPPRGARADVVPRAHVPAVVSPYRGAAPPSVPRIPGASAKRLTLGILAALVFTAAAVPFAVHLPRWIEAELVLGAWWAIWSVVLAVVAYRGAKVEDDHDPNAPPAVDFDGVTVKPKLSWLLDPHGCLVVVAVVAVLAVALAGAWLVVELVAPTIFIVAYGVVLRALAKAEAANTRGDVLRSAACGMGWAAVGAAPLAIALALVHAVVSA